MEPVAKIINDIYKLINFRTGHQQGTWYIWQFTPGIVIKRLRHFKLLCKCIKKVMLLCRIRITCTVKPVSNRQNKYLNDKW